MPSLAPSTAVREKSGAVNPVWNYCNELSFKAFERERRFLTYDMQPYTKDALHQLSTALVKNYGAIFIGNVKAARFVLDAGWSTFLTLLQYKCDDADVWFEKVDERCSTVTCSVCEKRTGPTGREGLRIREWTCLECGAHHDRDVDAARNILEAGRGLLAGGCSRGFTKHRFVPAERAGCANPALGIPVL